MAIAAGTVTVWDTSLIVSAPGRKATTYTGNGQVALPRIWLLGTGVKINYDAGDAGVGEGRIVQEFFDTGGSAFLSSMQAKVGQVGSLTLLAAEGGSETNDSAMLIKVEDTTPIQGTRSATWGRMTWEILGTWA